MQQLQLLGLLTLTVLMLNPSQCNPIWGQCAVDQEAPAVCMFSSQTSMENDYTQETQHMHLNRLNERSLAAWEYVRTDDPNRVPQTIHEARCLRSHSCNGVDSTFSVESVPISVRMPVLRKNPGCSFHSLEFETVKIACVCATTRQM